MAPPDPLLFKVERQKTVQAAQSRAARLWPTSRPFRGAYLKGWRAARAGLPMDACPYKRLYAGGNSTWGFTWRNVWLQGWLEGE